MNGYEEFENPASLTAAFVLGLLMIGAAVWGASAQAGEMVRQGLGLCLAIWFGLFAGANFWNWWAVKQEGRYYRRAVIDRQTPYSEAVVAASRLTEAQAATLPRLTYEMQVEATVGLHGEIGFLLATPGGPVPYAWIDEFLRYCTLTSLRPVRSYSDKSMGRQFAQAFTDWLVMHRYAVPHNLTENPYANGNHPAAWASENSLDQVRRALRLEELCGYEAEVNRVISDQ